MPPSEASTGWQCALLMLTSLGCVMGRKNLSAMYIEHIGRWKASQSCELVSFVVNRLASRVFRQKREIERKLEELIFFKEK